jgi:rare lipoprotein A
MKSKISLIAPLALLGACGGGGGLEELPPAPAMETPDRTYGGRDDYRRPDDRAPAPAAGADYRRPEPAPRGYATPDGAPPPSEGPQGSSQMAPGEDRYDKVGYAGYAGAGEGVFALSSELPAGSHVEVTALDTGKTVLLLIRGGGNGLLDLSGAAARQLGVSGNPAVRVRRTTVTPQDASLLAAGQPVPPRADAPPALLAGLRRRLGAQGDAPPPAAAPPRTPARAPDRAPDRVAAPTPPARATRGLCVQVAALSSSQRARALADELGGLVRSGGGLYRVQLGPFANAAAAENARADVARRGFGDARVISVP